LDTFEALGKPGESEGKPVVAGKPEDSDLYKLLVIDDDSDRMPKKADPLSQEEIGLIKRWIAEGAKFDGKDPKRLLSDLSSTRVKVATPEKYPRPLPITALAASPDGKLLAASGYGEVTLWDTTTLKLVGRIGDLPERITCLRWLGSGNTLAVAGGTPGRSGELWLADAIQRKPLKRLLTSPDTIQCLAVSDDGRLLAAGGVDNHVRLFEMPEARLRWDVEGHADWVMGLAFSQDSQLLASASRDRTARLFATANGEIKATHTAHNVAVLSVMFSIDGQKVYSGSADGEIHHWNLEGKEEKGGPGRPTREGVLQLSSGTTHRIFASLADKGVVELNESVRKIARNLTPAGTRVDALTFVAEPPALITGAQNGEVRIWDLMENKERSHFVAMPQ
ncbi:MAG: hypothetical protein JWO94_3363, partial [Verrucomicrobiaceae bacterium]|nr:hypothetical protein [Verrucomicrobiaceae bacterium]